MISSNIALPLVYDAFSLGMGLYQAMNPVQWGIFDSSRNPIYSPSKLTFIASSTRLSTAAMEYHKEARVSDFPVERGSFASYNKVEIPSQSIVVLCLSGSASDRAGFLKKLDAAAASTDLYSVVTPEATYINHTIERYNYSRRNSQGATLLTVEIFLKQVRQLTAPTSSTKSTGAAAPVNTGNVAGSPASPTTTATAQGLLQSDGGF